MKSRHVSRNSWKARKGQSHEHSVPRDRGGPDHRRDVAVGTSVAPPTVQGRRTRGRQAAVGLSAANDGTGTGPCGWRHHAGAVSAIPPGIGTPRARRNHELFCADRSAPVESVQQNGSARLDRHDSDRGIPALLDARQPVGPAASRCAGEGDGRAAGIRPPNVERSRRLDGPAEAAYGAESQRWNRMGVAGALLCGTRPSWRSRHGI